MGAILDISFDFKAKSNPAPSRTLISIDQMNWQVVEWEKEWMNNECFDLPTPAIPAYTIHPLWVWMCAGVMETAWVSAHLNKDPYILKNSCYFLETDCVSLIVY